MVDIYKWIYGERGREATMNPEENLARLLTPYRAAIRATALPILAAEVVSRKPRGPTGCQLGGLPWWPGGKRYPTDTTDKPLYLLAQFNFGDMPPLPLYPNRGLLQIFIGGDMFYGCNITDLMQPSGFRCVYHTDTSGWQAAMPDSEIRRLLEPGLDDAELPLEEPLKALALDVTRTTMPIDPTDYRFAGRLPMIDGDEDLLDAYVSEFGGPPIRLGGYPTFTQEDPRRYQPNDVVGTFSLLTVDSSEGIMWGDTGVAQFLMHEDDLMRRDFSKVAYNWDCC